MPAEKLPVIGAELDVHIKGAKGLLGKDGGLFSKATSDPYGDAAASFCPSLLTAQFSLTPRLACLG